MQQARPGPIRENTVFTRAQLKHVLQYLNGFTHRPGIGIRAEIPPFAAGGAAIVGNARGPVTADAQIRIRLVVAKKNVVARLEAFDQIVFEKKRLGLRSEEQTSEIQSLMRISYAVLCLKKTIKIIKPEEIKQIEK